MLSKRETEKVEEKPQDEKPVEIKKNVAKLTKSQMKVKKDKMLSALAIALATDPKLRKHLKSTKINNKDFDVDFSKVDPKSDLEKFH